MLRRLAVLVALGLAVAVPAAAQTEPARLAVTATSDHCAEGLPVVNYTLTNKWSTAVSVQAWWVADASVYDIAGTHQLGPAPDSTTGSFTLPFDFYATVTVYATVTWPDGQVTTNASWAIPVADCAAPAPPTTSPAEPTTTTTPAEPTTTTSAEPTTTTIAEPTTTTIAEPTTTVDDGNGNGNGNGNGYGHTTTTVEAG
jgi:hypothetical protein